MAVGGSSRHFSGKPDALGVPSLWKCPACGKPNEGRRPEQGCASCGAGVPGDAGKGMKHPLIPEELFADPHPETWEGFTPNPRDATFTLVTTTVVYRLIEYTAPPGAEAALAEVLRRSLVGYVRSGVIEMVATIVDSLDTRQQDLLRMAKRQPGVWLGNPTVSQMDGDRRRQELHIDRMLQSMTPRTPDTDPGQPDLPPDTGPSFSPQQLAMAQSLLSLGGLRFVHTLAMALSQAAQELQGNIEPEKFLGAEECLQLANACMSLIPADWNGEVSNG